VVIGFSPALRAEINQKHLRRGRLFGALVQEELAQEDCQALEGSGWTRKNYKDKAVLIPPTMTVAWDHEHAVFRDHVLHAAAHRLDRGLPVAGNAQAILEELIASAWEEREDQLRTVLNAFSFASLLPGPGEEQAAQAVPPGALDAATEHGERMEGFETFFFYARSMRDAAARAVAEAVRAPGADDGIWELVEALQDARWD
jgi:hypothetical protein